ncbi:hypothetical protein L207DRAFT_579025 [Hyaloscypha variabilis F]|jgi:hypothetical protein|uniref:Uncharacterized protein n=1 Tax=Hyaloscypha variabilis (strain UAMH 11265 / GT02V1 / F) TaxID=1149755 RepID=A0A2J6RZX6_HYAVF|nr:hypothetical protein L207DRAFT_579025 [Hyaloscypha variabilis F]
MPPKAASSEDSPSPGKSLRNETIHRSGGHGKNSYNGDLFMDKQFDKFSQITEALNQLGTKLDELATKLTKQAEEADIKTQFESLSDGLDALTSKVDSLTTANKSTSQKDVDDKTKEPLESFKQILYEILEKVDSLHKDSVENDTNGLDSEQFDEIKQAILDIREKINSASGLSEEQSSKFDARLEQLQVAADHFTAQSESQKDDAAPKSQSKKSDKLKKSDDSEDRNDFVVRINLWCKEGEKLIKGGHDLFTINSTLEFQDLNTLLAVQFRELFKKDDEGRSNFSDGVVYWTKLHKIYSVKADWGLGMGSEGWSGEAPGPSGTTLTTSNCKQFLKLLKALYVPTMTVIITVDKKKKRAQDNNNGGSKEKNQQKKGKLVDDSDSDSDDDE